MADLIDRQAAIDALLPLYQEHRYRIPGKAETYSQYNEAWQDALSRAEGAIFNLPSAEPVRHWHWVFSPDHAEGICVNCQFKIYGRPYQGQYLIVPYNYCPNCGSRMDGESDG